MKNAHRLTYRLCCALIVLGLMVTSCTQNAPSPSTPVASGSATVSTTDTHTTTQPTENITTQRNPSSTTATNSISTSKKNTTATANKTNRTTNSVTKKPSTAVVTSSTNSYTASDLFFPVQDRSLPHPKSATLTELSLTFAAAQRRVRIHLPEDMTLQLVGQGVDSYAVLRKNNIQVGRLVPNFIFPDTVPGSVEKETLVDGITVQTIRYTAGKDSAFTYFAFVTPEENFSYVLEISIDYILQADFAACLASLQSIQLLERDNRLASRNKNGLRIAVAGNSFIESSCVVHQLYNMLKANRKDATVVAYSYPNFSIEQYATDPKLKETLCGGNYDVLFLCGAYWAGDATALITMEKACQASGTELVLFPAHNEGTDHVKLAYRSSGVKMAFWKEAIESLMTAGIREEDLVAYDCVRHSKPLAGYCGAVMIYGMLYETAPNTAQIGVDYSGLPKETAQRVEDLTMEYIQPYYE